MSGLPRINGEFGVVKDPEMRFAQSGNAILSLRLKANKRVRDSNGNWNDGPTPLFIDCTVFGKMAEHLVESIEKGDSVIVDGVLEQQEWDDKTTGEKRSKVSIVADEIGVSVRWNPAKPQKEAREGTSSNATEGSPDDMPF